MQNACHRVVIRPRSLAPRYSCILLKKVRLRDATTHRAQCMATAMMMRLRYLYHPGIAAAQELGDREVNQSKRLQYRRQPGVRQVIRVKYVNITTMCLKHLIQNNTLKQGYIQVLMYILPIEIATSVLTECDMRATVRTSFQQTQKSNAPKKRTSSDAQVHAPHIYNLVLRNSITHMISVISDDRIAQ